MYRDASFMRLGTGGILWAGALANLAFTIIAGALLGCIIYAQSKTSLKAGGLSSMLGMPE